MDWSKDINALYEPLRELARYGRDIPVQQVLSEGVPELTDEQYDNWNGGTTYYTLAIHVPVPTYVAIERELAAIEKRILDRIEKLSRTDSRQHVNSVVIQPSHKVAHRLLPPQETRFWLPGHFRLFISHLSAEKAHAANLKDSLTHYAVTSFVAHEDIEPTKEWQAEIENGLFTMDALLAILSPDFHASKWTDQEVGVALGRGMVVLPVRLGLDPYGLMGKFQGIPGSAKKLGEVVDSVVTVLLTNPRTRSRFISCLVEQLLASPNASEATIKLSVLERTDNISSDSLTRIQDQAASSSVLQEDERLMRRVNNLLAKHGAEPVKVRQVQSGLPDEDIPF